MRLGRWLACVCALVVSAVAACAADPAFTLVVHTAAISAGSSGANQFTLPLRPGRGYNSVVTWGDGSSSEIVTDINPTHTYATPGVYSVAITEHVVGGFPAIYFNAGGDALKVFELSNWGDVYWATMERAFAGCANMAITASDGATAHTGAVVDFRYAWSGCYGLTSFPLIDTGAGTWFDHAWAGCYRLGAFPQLDTAQGQWFSQAWVNCSGLTSFPVLDLGAATRVDDAWNGCDGLTDFPLLNTSQVTSFAGAWANCRHLATFPMIDTTCGTDFRRAWQGCSALTAFPPIAVNSLDLTSTWEGCSALTAFPAVATGYVHTFDRAWFGCSGLTSFPLIDTHAATSLANAWQGCGGLTSFPLIDTAQVTTLSNAWAGCSGLTSFPLIDSHLVTDFTNAWKDCSGLSAFPLLDTAAGFNFSQTWYGCSGLTSFPLISVAGANSLELTWKDCNGLTAFPLIDTAHISQMNQTWAGCSGLTEFPLIDTHGVIWMDGVWQHCSGLTAFPLIDTGAVQSFSRNWQWCSGLTAFPMLDTASGVIFNDAWWGCSGLTSFPAIDTAQGTSFDGTWSRCSNLHAMPAVDLRQMLSGFDCFVNTTLDTASYGRLLQLLAVGPVADGVYFDVSGTTLYAQADAASRQSLITEHHWVIRDGGMYPVMTSAPAMTVAIDAPFSYTFTWDGTAPTIHAVLPYWLTLSDTTLSGTAPHTPETDSCTITTEALNGQTTVFQFMVYVNDAGAPVITSGDLTATTGAAISYVINATNTPATYGASPLPTGLGINASSGTIFGSVALAGTYDMVLSASNAHGTGLKTVRLTVEPLTPPPSPQKKESSSHCGLGGGVALLLALGLLSLARSRRTLAG